jgi:hypothetical protein
LKPGRTSLSLPDSTLAIQLHLDIAEGGSLDMLAGAIVAVLLIFGLFLSMLSSSPRADTECNPDTEA